MWQRLLILVLAWVHIPNILFGQTLVVKPDREAIVRSEAVATSPVLTNLPAATRVSQVGQIPHWYSLQLPDGRIGWSPKRNFDVVASGSQFTPVPATPVTAELLKARTDVLKIIHIDVEVGDATLIICPEENNRRDVILIDTGENDSQRIRQELIDNGFVMSTKPITRFIVTHYDRDHIGHAPQMIPLAEVVYDHGNNNLGSLGVDGAYKTAANQSQVDRRTMTLNYSETFSGGVVMKCVAVNQATDFDSTVTHSVGDDNPNSIALIISYQGFDYFTGGDLTKTGEASLATGIQNCDVYHANHHGSGTTSSSTNFVRKLDPEVSIASNGRLHGHPSDRVGRFLTEDPIVGGRFFQTNVNPDQRAYQGNPRFVADDDFTATAAENDEGAKGTITLFVDPISSKYYVVMPGLPLNQGTFSIEIP